MSAAALQNRCSEKFEDILQKPPVAEFLFPQPSKFYKQPSEVFYKKKRCS